MPSFYIPLSGLNADSTALNTIANNLSNMSTTGFKTQTTNFSDLFYQQVGTSGSGDEIEQGTGVQVASNSTDFTGGSISSTGVDTDAAINGSGFFVLDGGGGTQLYTRDGNFQTSSTGVLESTEGQAVMGYAATNGVVNTGGGLTDLSIPTGQVMQPTATTSFSMTQNLDSSSPVGTQVPGSVPVYDSLGNKYEATVTYTNLGNNQWSYAITLPDTLTAAAATAAVPATMSLSSTAPAATSVTASTTEAEPTATVPAPLTASAPTTTATTSDLAPAAAVAAPANSSALTVSTVTNAGTTTDTYNFAATGTVNTATTLGIQLGGVGPYITGPAIAPGEPLATYAANLQTAIGLPAVSGVTVSGTGGVLTISGATGSFATQGGVEQDVAETTTKFNFVSSNGAQATVDPTTSLTIQVGATGPVVKAPAFAAGESVANYATALQGAIGSPASSGVTVLATNGVLSITGPSDMTIGGNMVQSFSGSKTSYTFGSYTDPATKAVTQAGVDSSTSLTFTGLTTTSGAAAGSISVAPLIPGETVAQYASDIQNKLAGNNITGVTVGSANGVLTLTGPSGMTVSGYVNQDTLGTTIMSAIAPTNPTSTATVATLPAAAATPASVSTTNPAAVTPVDIVTSTLLPPDVTATATNYNFVSSNGTTATVDPTTTTLGIQIGAGPVISAPAFNPGETVAQYAAALQGAVGTPAATGVTIQGVNGQLSISGPANMTISGNVGQDFTGTNAVYDFGATGTIDPSTSLTNLKITGPTASGTTTTTALPTFTGTPETVADYATDLNTALSAAGIVGVTASASNGQLSIVGPSSIGISGTISQDVAMTTTNYNFVTSGGSIATVDPTSTLAILEGSLGPVSVPAFSTSQSVSTYATNLQSALTTAGITDVTVSSTGGVLSIKGPSNMTITGKVDQAFTGAQTNFDFGSYTDPNTGLTVQAMVAPSTVLTISGPTTAGGSATVNVSPSNPAGESVTQYVADVQKALANANITGVTVTSVNGVVSISGPDTVTLAGNVNQNMLGTTSNYTFAANSTVDPTTNLTLTGETASGTTATITAPTVTAGETVAQYAAALTSALSTAKITNISVTATNGQLSITGANLSTNGTLNQGLADTTVNYNFGSSATVNPSTAITIVGPTVSGTPPTAITTAPPVTAGETVAEYAADLTKALKAAGIDTGPDGVSVTATGGQLSIVGPASTLKTAGPASQDLTATTIGYNFGTSGGTVSAVDTKTNLTITGQTASGATATTVAPTIKQGETLNQYVVALNDALTTAGIAGVTVSSTAAGQLSITGANISTAGTVIQDPVSSANSTGTLTFNSSGNLVSPAADLSNITFAGLSDGAAPMNLTWNLVGANGTGDISQTAGQSLQSGQLADGYPGGSYNGTFAIGSDGTITADYSNGQNQIVGQIGLATVNNLQGLAAVGSTDYQTTMASGLATVGVAGTGGLGTLEGESLEASNVNISTEFSDLIIAQRAFEANSKAVTTFDTVTEETINMIH